MRILFTAHRHDPCDSDRASGADYQFYQSMLRAGFDVKVIGPFTQNPPILLERILKRLYKQHLNSRYIKYDFTNSLRASRALIREDLYWRPDVIFTMAPPPLAFYTGNTPCVFRTDTTFIGMHDQGAPFLRHGPVALRLMVWQEQRAFRKCARVVTQSEWSARVLIHAYRLPTDMVTYFPNPAALPGRAIPEKLDLHELKGLDFPLRLLTVGREFTRKGIDIAIDVVMQLNKDGIPAELTICGLSGTNGPYFRFVGRYQKSDASELEEYTDLYKRAHLLLHPARFDASPIVTSEAAAFGTPTITNNVGGLATSVKHGESGIVLPAGSLPRAYVQAIKGLLANEERYLELCRRTRERYERELNWDTAGDKVATILVQAAETGEERAV